MNHEDAEHRFELLMMMWDRSSLAALMPTDKYLMGRFADWVLGTVFSNGFRDLTEQLQDRMAIALLNAPVRPERELCRMAIELARIETSKRCDVYLSKPFTDHDSIVKHSRRFVSVLPNNLIQRMLAEACQAYEKEDYFLCACRCAQTFAKVDKGYTTILYAWFTPSPARRSVQA